MDGDGRKDWSEVAIIMIGDLGGGGGVSDSGPCLFLVICVCQAWRVLVRQYDPLDSS